MTENAKKPKLIHGPMSEMSPYAQFHLSLVGAKIQDHHGQLWTKSDLWKKYKDIPDQLELIRTQMHPLFFFTAK